MGLWLQFISNCGCDCTSAPDIDTPSTKLSFAHPWRLRTIRDHARAVYHKGVGVRCDCVVCLPEISWQVDKGADGAFLSSVRAVALDLMRLMVGAAAHPHALALLPDVNLLT